MQSVAPSGGGGAVFVILVLVAAVIAGLLWFNKKRPGYIDALVTATLAKFKRK